MTTVEMSEERTTRLADRSIAAVIADHVVDEMNSGYREVDGSALLSRCFKRIDAGESGLLLRQDIDWAVGLMMVDVRENTAMEVVDYMLRTPLVEAI